ncbi:hypothetical protein GCK72_017075 [Caenorhabditis remanei]|uniref:Uncharacterized protein n=1 Tax=Caenorhabditis remanei TaxID=31234 RepID=A0A6A5G783_CAERE|nr:hypothetical protein GCK72_017075 [Caenorhabditis remanei]KAF1750525.1 hypothetical protein GCK72_017075 [Caenorhabditis remanei]
MKLHIILDHMVPNIRFESSPMLSSAAPFERLNQSLGRNTDVYTTRSLIDMTTKFMASHRANYYCEKSVDSSEFLFHDFPCAGTKDPVKLKKSSEPSSCCRKSPEPLTCCRKLNEFTEYYSFIIPISPNKQMRL